MTKQQTKNKNLWEILHKQSRFRLKYPHERVIQFIFSNFQRDKSSQFRILDHGCGCGRHTIFLAENGYNAYGCDCSKDGIDFAKNALKERGLTACLQLIDKDYLGYRENYFDGIICFGVLYYLSSRQLDKTIPELFKILKKNGRALIVLRSKKDYRFRHTNKSNNNDYLIVGDKKTRVNNENGMLMHFFTKNEIYKRFNMFRNILIDEMYCTYNNGQIFDHDYIVELYK